MKIEVLGPGCQKCNQQLEEANKAVVQSGLTVEVAKVDKIDRIMSYGVMVMPALVVDGQVKCSGRVANAAEIATWLTPDSPK